MLNNCPNCGAPLSKDGWCDYCKTKVRMANLMEITYGYFNNKPVEILIKLDNGDGTITYMPFKGVISEIEIKNMCNTVDFGGRTHYVSNNPDIQLTLNGHLCEIPEAEKQDIRRSRDDETRTAAD